MNARQTVSAKLFLEPDKSRVIAAAREFVGSVGLVTVGRWDLRSGMVTKSLFLLSIEPPRLVLCVGAETEIKSFLERERCFGVSLLCAHHETIADNFSAAHNVPGNARYAEGHWRSLGTGVSLLADALTAMDCEVEEMIERHSNTIVIGRICAIAAPKRSGSLVSWRGGYEQLGWGEGEAELAVGL